MFLILLSLSFSQVFSSPLINASKRGVAPVVQIANGTITGNALPGVENFKGIPYAQPPVGDLRLRPPQPLTEGFGSISTQLLPKACPQFWASPESSQLPQAVAGMITSSPLFQEITLQDEDCLTLSIQRPAGTAPDAKLPVVFWIFGGGFAIGASHLYDGSRIVLKSVALKQPIIYVAINYRLGGFGFLPGKEVSADGSSNLGIKDQRLALQWIQENIAAFGGDPSKVVLWGESAGAISNTIHTIAYGGDISYKGGQLFRGAIMNSGTTTPTVAVDHPKAQAIYDTVAAAGGCAVQADSLGCLRALPYQQLRDAMATVSSFYQLNLSYLPRPDPADQLLSVSPEMAVQAGNFAKVPLIVGDQQDEGTLFALTQTNISDTNDLVDYLAPTFPLASREVVAGLVNSYPDNASAGSPFNTFFLNNIYPQFKRLAAILGDASFTLQRRSYLATVASQVPAWSYIANYGALIPVLGTFHASDILSTFFNIPPVLTTDSILTYYISFINHLDPNKIPNWKSWPQYDTSAKQLLQYGALSHDVITDDFRSAQYAYFLKNQNILRV